MSALFKKAEKPEEVTAIVQESETSVDQQKEEPQESSDAGMLSVGTFETQLYDLLLALIKGQAQTTIEVIELRKTIEEAMK